MKKRGIIIMVVVIITNKKILSMMCGLKKGYIKKQPQAFDLRSKNRVTRDSKQ